jgi:hypothetical protein
MFLQGLKTLASPGVMMLAQDTVRISAALISNIHLILTKSKTFIHALVGLVLKQLMVLFLTIWDILVLGTVQVQWDCK